jgi:hypothetical protein
MGSQSTVRVRPALDRIDADARPAPEVTMPPDATLALLPLDYAQWKDTCTTLHMWTQIVGKIRLALAPQENHWWNVTLYVGARGLTTSLMPHGQRGLQIDFDFVDHVLVLRTTDGAARYVPLFARSVAAFHAEVTAVLEALGAPVRIWPVPVELDDPIPFAADTGHASYDVEFVRRWWQITLWSDGVLREFRTRFIGKCSPVHFFWGSFDLAVTRFSGRRAPEDPKLPSMEREAYSHEVISAGFWPGAADMPQAAYYSYTSPAPEGLERAHVRPTGVLRQAALPQFVLPYEIVRTASSPRALLLDFLQSTYDVGADLARWDRAALERTPSNVRAASASTLSG